MNDIKNDWRRRKRGSSKEIISRNDIIKKDFMDLRKEGVKKEPACEYLAGKYFLSVSRINSIIYSK